MIISEQPPFICFQPWKCASSTLFRRLEKYDVGRYPQTSYVNKILGRKTTKHIALKGFLRLPESEWDATRFVFVRNPYDRYYSGFVQRRHRNKMNVRRKEGFTTFEKRAIDDGFDAYVAFTLSLFRRTGRTHVGSALHDHVFDAAGATQVDLVGFVETFEASLAEISERVGLEPDETEDRNVRFDLTAEQSGAISDLRYRYIDQHTDASIAAINEIYARDFEPFGYRKLTDASSSVDLSPFADAQPETRSGNHLALRRG